MRLSLGLFAFWTSILGMSCVSATPLAAQGPPAQPPAIVVVSPVIEATLPPGASFIGITEGARVTSVGSAVDGRVNQVFVDEGDEVTLISGGAEPAPNPPLVELKSETIRSELEAAEAELENRNAMLEEIKLSQPEELLLLKATYDEATATEKLAQSKYDIAANLFQRQGNISRDQFDEATANLEIAVQRRIAASSELRRFETTSELRIAQAQARVTGQSAEVEKLEDQLFKHTMRSPFSGVVVRRLVEVGDWVARGQVVAEVVELEKVHIRVFVPEEQIQGLNNYVAEMAGRGITDIPIEVGIDALRGSSISGRLYRIIPQADSRSRAFPVLVEIDNERVGNRFLIGSGMLARATLPVGEPGLHTLVSKDALVLGGASPIVMVARETANGLSAVPVPVTTGTSVGDLIVVKGALQAGEKVVVEGNERLIPGQSVRILSEKPVTSPGSSETSEAAVAPEALEAPVTGEGAG